MAADSPYDIRQIHHDGTLEVMETPLGRVLPRHVAEVVRVALTDTRVVLINGARQCGKSTLARLIGNEQDATWLTLDNAQSREAARYDPTEFVSRNGLTIIDEVQREPDLLLAIKERVDENPRPGQYLLTDSARVMPLRVVPDALPGRMETVELWPLSQGEIDGTPDGFVDAAFASGPELAHTSALSKADYIERLVRGGFPEAVARTAARRERFLDSYLSDLLRRDVMQLAEIQRSNELARMLRLLAARSGQILVASNLAADLGLPQSTTARYLSLLEEVFLIRRIPAWSASLTRRATATPKVAFVDSGVAANILGQRLTALSGDIRQLDGLLEGFVAMELLRQLSWSEERVQLSHYRTRDKVEVDIVLENRQGQVIGIEVKAASSVATSDFSGLRHLQRQLGERFLVGLVLYTGKTTVPFGPHLRAMPISAIWETAR